MMNLRLVEPDVTATRRWSAFDGRSGYTPHWWSGAVRGDDSTSLQVMKAGDEVARVLLLEDLHLPTWGLTGAALRGPLLRIQFLEVRMPERGQGVGTETVDLLRARDPGRHLIALSENDAFWDHLGWSRHIHVEDLDNGHGMFQPLYVDPVP